MGLEGSENKASIGAKVSMDSQVTRGKKMRANAIGIATQRREVFFTWYPGRLVQDPVTGELSPCLRDTVGPHGLPGHWYDGGTTTSQIQMTKAEYRALRRRIFKEKILLKLKGFLNGLQRK